jgi:aspartate aminotransferase
MGESATLKVTRRANELRAAGVDVVDFGAGEPDFASPAAAVEAACAALAGGFTRYTTNAGIPELRDAVAGYYAASYGAPWQGGDVLVGVGGKAVLFELAMALFEPGDEVVLPSPYWVSFTAQIRCAGARPVLVPTRGEDGFRIHADALLAAVGPKTRAILVNAPCNPTGGVISAADLERLVVACAERGLMLISDETYERFVYDGAQPVSVAALARRYPETVVLVGSFSKTFAMTGWRVGYAIGPRAVINAAAVMQSHVTSNATSFAQRGALAAIERAQDTVPGMIAEYAVRRDLLVPRLNALPGVRCRPPAGAFYVFPEVRELFDSRLRGSLEVAEYLLEQAGVAVVPGIAFGSDDHVRISFACSQRELLRGLDRMAEAFAALAAG